MSSLKLQVQQDIFDPKSLQDEENFYHQRQGQPDDLTKKLVYILGSKKNRYPISMQTMSTIAPKGSSVGVSDVQFKYPTMGRMDKASVLAEDCTAAAGVVNGPNPGLGNSIFKLRFTDNWIKRYYIIESSRGVQAYVTQDPVQVSPGIWEYEVVLDAVTADAICPESELAAGVLWVDLNVQVAESQSRSTESKSVAPGEYKNQLGFTRAGMSWAGNAANKVMKINVSTDKGSTNVWMDFFMWQFENRWLEECEHMYWYSRYNRKTDGTIALKDRLTGKIIPRGSGLLEQIQHKSTYTSLTYNTLVKKIGNALFGHSDADGMTITLYTGTGGRREFHEAMLAKGASFLTDFSGVADKFVTGSGRELMLGGFFDGFYHVDGYIIKVKYHPMFDNGRIALKSPRHPVSGLPLESYRMVFIDDGDVEGQPNIQHVYENGRPYLHGVVSGLTPMPKSLQIMGGFDLEGKAIQKMSSDVDEASYHRFKSQGVQLLRGDKCFDLQCLAGVAA